jgi:predicted amidohydrolase YtcJ
MSVDGAFSGQAAWLIDSYPKRPGYHGTVRIPPEILYPVAKRAHDLGWQLGIHAIGDDAVQKTVDVIERVQRENPRPDARHYLHHISVKPPEATIKKMAANGIIGSMQPNFTYTIAPFYAQALAPEKLQTNNPQKSLMDAGMKLSIGSDNLPDGPLIGIYGAVMRKGTDGKVYGPQERLTLEQAIYNATVGTAYMTFDEKNRGTLVPGMLADMVVLEEDIFKIDPEKIRTLRVLKTIVGGETLWSLTQAAASEVPNLIAMSAIDPVHGMAHALGHGCDEHEH